jgi:hypothetical protein
VGKFLEVQFAECFQSARTFAGEVQTHGALVVGVGAARNQSGGLSAIDQLDRAVVAQQQVIGDVADRRPTRIRVAADGKQQLMLSRGQAGGLSLTLTPSHEAP